MIRRPPISTRTEHSFPTRRSSDLPIWNHKLKWRGESVTRYNNQMIVQQNGDYQLTKIIEDVSFPYASIKDPHAITSGNGEYLEYLSHVVAPPRLAGTYILVHVKTGTAADGRAARPEEHTYEPQ